ncbi:MAG: Spy/CpxP family protein refolding chaperone [Verrucomicrobiae bacterium]|nr:Spy/CpxP family protein refolding chaperone [Verrucomicrobiae bacterium]
MKTIIALLVTAVVVAVISFGLTRSLRMRPLQLHETEWLRRQLKLTDDQTAEVRKLEADFLKRLAECCARHCAARAELADALNDPKKAAECCAQMCAAQAESERAALDHILQVRALLTVQQQERYTALVRRALSGPCTMRLHKQ